MRPHWFHLNLIFMQFVSFFPERFDWCLCLGLWFGSFAAGTGFLFLFAVYANPWRVDAGWFGMFLSSVLCFESGLTAPAHRPRAVCYSHGTARSDHALCFPGLWHYGWHISEGAPHAISSAVFVGKSFIEHAGVFAVLGVKSCWLHWQGNTVVPFQSAKYFFSLHTVGISPRSGTKITACPAPSYSCGLQSRVLLSPKSHRNWLRVLCVPVE